MSVLVYLYDLAVGVVTLVGLGYLLYSQRYVLGYRRFLYPVVAGTLVFSVAGPVVDAYFPTLLHLFHGLAALLVAIGLYTLVHDDLHANEWTELLLRDPRELRHPSDWMVPMDEEILELFHSTELVLTPSIIAHNIDYSREEVNRRLSELAAHDFVTRVDRGKYRITEFGERYLRGVDESDSPVIDRLQSKLTHR